MLDTVNIPNYIFSRKMLQRQTEIFTYLQECLPGWYVIDD